MLECETMARHSLCVQCAYGALQIGPESYVMMYPSLSHERDFRALTIWGKNINVTSLAPYVAAAQAHGAVNLYNIPHVASNWTLSFPRVKNVKKGVAVMAMVEYSVMVYNYYY